MSGGENDNLCRGRYREASGTSKKYWDEQKDCWIIREEQMQVSRIMNKSESTGVESTLVSVYLKQN